MGFFFSLVLTAGLTLAGALLRPKPKFEDARPAGLGDFDFPTATEWRPVQILFGTAKVSGPNVVWYGDLYRQPIADRVKTGLFSHDLVVTGYKYHVGIQFGICGGEVDALTKIYVGRKTVWSGDLSSGSVQIDKPALFGGDDGAGGVVGKFSFFPGSLSQAVSSYLEPFQDSVGAASAYRGFCYGVFERGYVGNAPRVEPWAFEARRIPTGATLAADELVNGKDANIANVIYEAMTDAHYGLGLPAADFDLDSFQAAGTTLKAEGNGFSTVVTTELEVESFIQELERQADGVVYQDPATGKFKFALIREDYVLDDQLELGAAEVLEVDRFDRGSWDETTDAVLVRFNDRDDKYKETLALAQDLAAHKIHNRTPARATQRYPGVKDRTLANKLAARDLRSLSAPRAVARLVVNRKAAGLVPGSVVLWTNEELGLSKLPMRVTEVHPGDSVDRRVVLDLVQDVFTSPPPPQGDPPGSGWSEPGEDLDAIPANESTAVEAPLGLLARDPGYSGAPSNRVWCGGRRQEDAAEAIKVLTRHAAGTPSGSYVESGLVRGLYYVGKLKAALAAGSGVPLATLDLTADPDTKEVLSAEFATGATPEDLGRDLVHLLLVGSEFMLAQSAAVQGSDVRLTNVYRGVLDTPQQDHALGDRVHLLFAGGGFADPAFPDGDTVHVKLLPKSNADEVAEADAPQLSLTVGSRSSSPYAPSRIALGGTQWASTVSLESLGTTFDTLGFRAELTRRDLRGLDEVAALTTDAEDLFPDFPSAHTTEHDVEVRNDPDGANTLLYTGTTGSKTFDVLRTKVLRHVDDGALPTRLRLVVTARHTYEGTSREAAHDLTWDFDVTSALSGQFNYGALDTNETSNSYTVDAAGTHDFSMGTAFASGKVLYRVNGGSWQTLMAAGSTAGSVTGLSVGDTLEIGHTTTVAGTEQVVLMSAPSGGTDAYGVLYV